MAAAFVAGEFGKFLATGGVAAGVNLVTRWLFSQVMVFELAVVLAYLCGMVVAYVLARLIVFARSGRRISDEIVRFALVNLAGMAQVWLVSVGLVRFVFPMIDWVWHPEDVAHFIGVAVPAVTSYLGHRHFSFAARRSDPGTDNGGDRP